MNDTLPTLSTRTRVAQSSGLRVVLATFFLVSSSWGDEPPSAPLPGPVLNLIDGGVVPGTLADSRRPGTVGWKSDSFEAPFEFPWDEIQSIRFPTAGKATAASGTFGFELSGGDLLFGSIINLDDKAIEVDVPKLRRLRIDRARIQRISRWSDGEGMVYNGPNGLAGWREFTPPKPRRKRTNQAQGNVVFARENFFLDAAGPDQPAMPGVKPNALPPQPGWVEDGGALESKRDRTAIQTDVGLAARANVELELSWKQTPNFVVALGVSDDEKTVERASRLEVWDGQVVALRETDKAADVAPLQSVGVGPGRAHLQLFLDQELGKLLVFSENGDPLADLKLGGSPGAGLTGVRLTNLQGDVRLDRLRVRRWDGESPHPLTANESHILLADQSIVRGRVDRFDAASREFVVQGESGVTRVPEGRVVDIRLPQAEGDSRRPIQVAYQDGTRLGGEWLGVEGGRLFLMVPGVADPLQLPTEGLRSMTVAQRDAKPRDRGEAVGTLDMDGLRVQGRLVNSSGRPGEGNLAWQPLASETASTIRPGASGRIIYQTPSPKTTANTRTTAQGKAEVRLGVQRDAIVRVNPINRRGPAPAPEPVMVPTTPVVPRALYLRSGDIIPVEVTKIDEEGVWFETKLSDNHFVPNARVKAVELAADDSAAIRMSKAKFDRLLTLPRMQKDSPPTHLIRSKGGDILRGRVVGMDDKIVRAEVRLEEKSLPRDRISRIIWLHADETDPSKKPAGPPEGQRTTRVQAVRSDGTRLTFAAEGVTDGTLLGKSDVLGVCKVKLQELDQLLIGGSVEKEATQLAYQNYKLQNAPEPKSAQGDGGSSPNGGAAGTEAALVGKRAPPFRLDLLEGGKFDLAESKGKVVVLDFWATWCGPCLQAMPQIERVSREFADQGVQLIAVNLQETPAKITAMLERQKLSPKVALDRDGAIAEKYGATAIPQTVVIDREGKVTRLFIGGGPRLGDQLREALQATLALGQPQ